MRVGGLFFLCFSQKKLLHFFCGFICKFSKFVYNPN